MSFAILSLPAQDLSLRGRFGLKVYKYLFFVLFIFCPCTKSPSIVDLLPKEDRKDVLNLLNYFLFDHQVAFVLFGSKPMSEIILHQQKDEESEKKLLAALPKEIQKQAKIVKQPFNAYECWKTWKRNQARYDIRDFLFAERPLKIDPSAIVVFVINIEKTTDILSQYYDYFKSVFGGEFDPKREIHKIRDPDSLFWNSVLADHIAKGLLFGYGEKNARFFAKVIQEGLDDKNFKFSTTKQIDPYRASKRNFSIPKFRSLQDEKILGIYIREQKEIEEVYRKGDLLEITLKRLTGSHF